MDKDKSTNKTGYSTMRRGNVSPGAQLLVILHVDHHELAEVDPQCVALPSLVIIHLRTRFVTQDKRERV